MPKVQEAWDSILCVLLSTLLLSSCCLVMVAPTRGGNCQNPVRLSNPQSSPIGVDPARTPGPPARPPAARPTGPCASGGTGGRPGGASMPLPPPPPQMGGVMFPQPAAPAAAQRWILGQRLRLAIAHVREFGAWLEWATRCRRVLCMVLHNFTATRSRILATML